MSGDLSQQFQSTMSLHPGASDQQPALHKKRSQRFTVQRPPSNSQYQQQPNFEYSAAPIERTISADSVDYAFQGPPPFFNPVIAPPSHHHHHHLPPMSIHHLPPMSNTMYHPQLQSMPIPNGLLPGQEEPSDEIIPTAIVIKNIPFSVPKEQVMAVMDALALAPPYAFNYHYDVAGPHQPAQFRGLAFANFRDPAETSAALAALNGYEIQGRRLRVEYKRMLRIGEKEKIEREKALKRMRSAVGLNGTSSNSPSSMDRFQPDQEEALPSASNFDGPNVWNSTTTHAYSPASSSAAPSTAFTTFAPSTANTVASPGSSDLESGSASMEPSGSSQASSGRGRSYSTVNPSSTVRTELDMNDPQTLEIYSKILLFKDDALCDELAFSRSLTGMQRRLVHLVAQRLGLEHKSLGEGDSRFVIVYKNGSDADTKTITKEPSFGNLRGKKSMPDMRPPLSSAHSSTIGSRKSNNDLRSASRRERGTTPTLQGVFTHQGIPPPVPSLIRSNSPYTDEQPSSPSNSNGSYRQARGLEPKVGSLGRASTADSWRRAHEDL